MVEHVRYTVVKIYPGFELRHYEPYALVSVDASGDLEEASYRGFGPLFRYISGGNVRGEKIAMTAPVFQQEMSPALHRISFAMPQEMAKGEVPAPDDQRLATERIPAHYAVALTFRGSWSAQRLREKVGELAALMAAHGLVATAAPRFARYDPPYKPPVFRRNEVIIPVAPPEGQ